MRIKYRGAQEREREVLQQFARVKELSKAQKGYNTHSCDVEILENRTYIIRCTRSEVLNRCLNLVTFWKQSYFSYIL